MRTATFLRIGGHNVKPLVIRGGLARTFGSLASFLAGIFLLLGLYLLGDAFEHPLDAQSTGVLAAALSLALAAILIYFLLKPRRGLRSRAARLRRAG